MGNSLNITIDSLNNTNITNGTLNPFNPAQTYQENPMERLWGPGFLLLIALILNIVFVVCIRLHLRNTPYLFLENIIVVDIITSITSGPLWMFGIVLVPITLDIPFLAQICRVSGFFYTSLMTVFLNTIIVISVSRFIFVLSPTTYTTIFKNNVTNRILLFAVWMYSIALSAPPLNPGVWGEYHRFDTICIPKWSSEGDLSYPLFHTVLTLVPAVFCTVAAFVVIALKRNRIDPMSNPQLNRSLPARRVNVEVLYISLASLTLYIAIWLPLVLITNSNTSNDPVTNKLNFDRKHASNMILLYFMYARGILHPIIYLVVSGEMRGALVSVFSCRKFRVGQQPTTAPMA